MSALQVPLGYEEIKKKPLAMPRILSPSGYEEIPDKPPSPTMPVKVEPTPMKPPTKPGDWKKELIGGLAYKAAKRSYDISTGKYMEPLKTKKYWIEAGKNLSKGVGHFLRAITGMPGRQEEEEARLAAMRGAVGEERPPPAKVAGIIGKEVGKMGFEFAAFLPKIGIALAADPVKEVRDNPVGVGLFVFSVLGASGAKIRAKVKAGKPVLKQDMAKAIDSIPESILTKKQKAKIKPALPDMEIMGEIKKVSKLRREQEVLFSKERGKRFQEAREVGQRIQGEKGFYAEKAKLEGELPKVEYKNPIFSQGKVDNLFITIANSRKLNYLQSVSARDGLLKLLGKKEGLPQTKQIEYLTMAFGEAPEAIIGKLGIGEVAKKYALEATNVPRALMASYDLSFLGRQGIFIAARHPKIWLRAFMKQFKMFGVEKTYQNLMQDIRSRPNYDLMVNGDAIFGKKFKHKVALTERGEGVPLSLREEAFMGAELAEKIPVVGLGVRASNRAYTGTGNRLRADLFDSMIKRANKVGRNPYKEPKMVEGIIKLTNAATGRGNLPEAIKSSAALLNATLFSPRLISSRLSLLNPKFYIKLGPVARREAVEQLFAFAGMIATTLGIAKLAGAEVEMQLNPLKPISADWGKIKIGDTRIDIMGGFQQYIRAAFQFMSGKVVSTTSGKVTEVGKGFKPITRLDIALRPLEYKLAPTASFAVALIRGRTAIGEPVKTPKEISSEVAKRFIPMVIQDVADLARDDPDLLPLAGLGFFGFGLQTYKPKKKKEMVVY